MRHPIETHKSLEDFFSNQLQQALLQRGVALHEGSLVYLLNVCAEFARHEALHGCERTGERGTPALVWLYQRAQEEGDRGLRFQAYRHLGDVALVVGGFFTPHIERARSLVGVDYYIRMGSAAYDSAAALAPPTGFRVLLKELAVKFRQLIEVFTRLAEQINMPVAQDTGSLCERLGRFPESQDLQRRLVDQGLIPIFAPVGAKC